MAALKREVILKKPEVFKMACLNDIKNLYGEGYNPFYAGFGNRITDALSYRSVNIPSSRIFTINPVGEVHMELLELAGYKSSYVYINELVDHFFPPVDSGDVNDEHFTDVNFWREPLPDLSDLSDEELNSENKNEFNEYSKKEKEKIDIDELDKNYNEDEDEDYQEGDEEDEEDEYDDGDEYDLTDQSDDGSYDDDDDEEDELDEEDLDQELLEAPIHEQEEQIKQEQKSNHQNLQSGFLPLTPEKSGLSLNQKNVNGIHSPNSFIKASDLMNKLSISDMKAGQKKK